MQRLYKNPLQLCVGILALFGAICLSQPANAQVRIKDVVNFEGVRDNILLGVGLVVGLNGTGDNLNDAVFTQESLIGMLERAGISGRINDLNVENVAAVSVTAILPPFARPGDAISVNVSALGTAGSIEGGTLLATALEAADGEVYAVAQGTVSIGRVDAGANANASIPTNGRITNGGLIERSTNFKISELNNMHLSLKNPDFTTARRIRAAINTFIGFGVATVVNPGTVRISTTDSYQGGLIDLITDIEQLRIKTDTPAKVIIDVASGVVVMGSQVQISEIAIAHGALNVQIQESANQQSGLLPFVNRDQVDAAEVADAANLAAVDTNPNLISGNVAILNNSVTLQHLINGLNALGIEPEQLISILQAIKASGALQADIELM